MSSSPSSSTITTDTHSTYSQPQPQTSEQPQPQSQSDQHAARLALHPAPPPFIHTDLTLLTQGAEALVYKTTYLTPDTSIALKHRPRKPWRHRLLDARLTRARILAEARVLVRCRRLGVRVPAVLGLDWDEGWLALEWVDGLTVRNALHAWKAGGGEPQGEEVRGVMERVGKAVGGLHESGVVHGDLTTSNLMLGRPRDSAAAAGGTEEKEKLEGEVVMIDFGLAQQSSQEEDRAVDLYVLERAFASTHPEAEEAFEFVLRAYGESYKGAKIVLKRLEDVRMRGRKKSMLG